MQRTIYVRDEIWESIKKVAKSSNRSISNYLVGLHFEMTAEEHFPVRLFGYHKTKNKADTPNEQVKNISLTEPRISRALNDEYVAEVLKEKKADIPKEKIKEAIKKHKVISESFDYFNPQLKKG